MRQSTLSGLATLVALLWCTGAVTAQQESQHNEDRHKSFVEAVNYDNLGRIAVHSEGRVKSFGSFARSTMHRISGSKLINDQPPMFTYLDFMIRSHAYENEPVIYVKKKPVRERIAHALRESFETRARSMMSPPAGGDNPQLEQRLEELDVRMARFMETGLVSESILRDAQVTQELDAMRQDLIRTASAVNELNGARQLMDPDVLRNRLRLIAPPGGDFDDPWMTFEDLDASMQGRGRALASVDIDLKRELLGQWGRLQRAWRDRDAQAVNEAAGVLADLLPQVNPELYPGEGSRSKWPWAIESLNWKWITSATIAAVLLAIGLAGVGTRRWTLARVSLACAVGWMAFLGGAMTLGRINPLPLESWYFATYNMTWVWVVYALALVPLLLSLVFRWRGAHWIGFAIFLVGFALHTTALLVRWYVSDRWPNSNMFEAVTTAAWFGGAAAMLLEVWVWRSPMRSLFALGSAAASMVALMCAYYMPVNLDPNISNMMPVLHDLWLYIHTNVIIFSYCLIFMAAVTAILYLIYRLIQRVAGGSGVKEFARMGGAASLIQTTPDGETYIAKARTSLGQVLDGTTMILMELSFVLLWAGLVMGAIWADHSWGRPWGWDPKEVFALNTFIVFAVLIHVRLKTADKGMWTALIALIGAAVMLFNWIAINFVVVGLHSYA